MVVLDDPLYWASYPVRAFWAKDCAKVSRELTLWVGWKVDFRAQCLTEFTTGYPGQPRTLLLPTYEESGA